MQQYRARSRAGSNASILSTASSILSVTVDGRTVGFRTPVRTGILITRSHRSHPPCFPQTAVSRDVFDAATDGGEGAAASALALRRTESLENLLTCSICLDIMFQPVTAPCNHHYCLPCLRRLLEYDGGETPCPNCRRPLAMNPDELVVDTALAEVCFGVVRC